MCEKIVRKKLKIDVPGTEYRIYRMANETRLTERRPLGL